MLPQIRPTRDDIEAALRLSRLDRTLTTTLPPADPTDDYALGATSIPGLDAQLGGGFPRGQLSELVGARSSGRTSVLLRTIAATTARGELAAVVDALDMLDIASVNAAGIDVARLLWIRGDVVAHAGTSDRNERALDRALKALTLVLQAGNFGLVALDLGEAPIELLRRLPPTTWLRLQRMVEGTQVVCVLLGNHPLARSAAGLTLRLEIASRGKSTSASGVRFGERMFEGVDIETRVVRARVREHEGAAGLLSTTASPYA